MFLQIDTAGQNTKPEQYMFSLYGLLFFVKLQTRPGCRGASPRCSLADWLWSISLYFTPIIWTSAFQTFQDLLQAIVHAVRLMAGEALLLQMWRLRSTEHLLPSTLWFNTLTSEPLTCVFWVASSADWLFSNDLTVREPPQQNLHPSYWNL